METQRLLLYLAFGFLSLIIYQTWVADYHAPLAPVVESGSRGEGLADSAGVVDDLPGALPPAVGDAVPGSVPGSADLPGDTRAAADSADGATDLPRVHVRTDVLDVDIDTVGATIARVELLDYAVSVEQPDVPFALMSPDPAHYLVAQSGLQAAGDKAAPIHREPMQAEADEYGLAEGENTIVVPFTWESDGIKVTKSITFTRGRYEIGVSYRIENNGAEPYVVNQYRQLKRKPGTKDERQQFVNTYIGGVYSNPEDRYQKVKFSDMEDENLNAPVTDGWVAMIQHYFAAAWIPTPNEPNTAYTRFLPNENRYIIGMVSAPVTVAPGGTAELSTQAYIGPKIQDRLAAVAPNLELTVDYGWLTIIAQPLFWLLKTIHGVIGNWGFAIILVTFVIKAVFYKLSEASYRSMARMKKLQPKLAALKERHGDDRAAMGQATMELYKKEKVNPLGGCLPMIVQIPVFIALYWTLLESVELRQAPWILWIEDLSIRDPLFILPVIMAATMFLQQKLNPAPVDPIQQKVFQFLPLIFGVFFAFFPAGLVLYWVVNNSLSIAQQYYITRHVLAEGTGGGAQPSGGKQGGLLGRLGGLAGGAAKTHADATAVAIPDPPTPSDAAETDAEAVDVTEETGSDDPSTSSGGEGPEPGGTPGNRPHRPGKKRGKKGKGGRRAA